MTLWDWDAVGKNDEIGSIRIPAARLTDLFRAELGSAAEESFPVMQAGKPVVGHDKNQTKLKVFLTCSIDCRPPTWPDSAADSRP